MTLQLGAGPGLRFDQAAMASWGQRACHDRRVRRTRTVEVALPTELATRDGLAYTLWLPKPGAPIRGGVVILHGAGSCKENHHDFARALLGADFAAIVFDQRGHGESKGEMDARVLHDVAAMAELLREKVASANTAGAIPPIVLRGSSMGGYLAILAAPLIQAKAIVAICPASAEGLRRGLASGRLSFDADARAFDAFLAEHDLEAAVQSLEVPLLLLHAEGDEQVPVEHSRELARHMHVRGSRLITIPGGHHRSLQHDHEIQAISLRWVERTLAGERASRRSG